jgi:RimJ/RimL family protein N-acetyltransferase
MSFDLQPVLKGKLLELRPLRADDFDDLFAVARDPLIWEQHPASDRYQEERFRVFFREALESGGALVAIDTRDGRVIGSSRFHGYDPDSSEVEIGWTFLARSRWGGRYNGEVARASSTRSRPHFFTTPLNGCTDHRRRTAHNVSEHQTAAAP